MSQPATEMLLLRWGQCRPTRHASLRIAILLLLEVLAPLDEREGLSTPADAAAVQGMTLTQGVEALFLRMPLGTARAGEHQRIICCASWAARNSRPFSVTSKVSLPLGSTYPAFAISLRSARSTCFVSPRLIRTPLGPGCHALL